ncbi:MAG: hypothetical protein V3R90_14005, partial [Limibaculum sp.]
RHVHVYHSCFLPCLTRWGCVNRLRDFMSNRAPPNAAAIPESNAVGMVFHHIELNATPAL